MAITLRTLEGVELTDMPGDNFGFIYEVTHLPTGRKYIGKKQLISVTKKSFR